MNDKQLNHLASVVTDILDLQGNQTEIFIGFVSFVDNDGNRLAAMDLDEDVPKIVVTNP